MIPLQILHILDLESLQEEIIESEHGDGIIEIEAQHEGLQEITGPLDAGPVLRFLALPNIDSLLLHVHPDLQFHVLDHSLAYFLPVVLQRRHAIRRDHYRLHLEVAGVRFVGIARLVGLFYQFLWLHC